MSNRRSSSPVGLGLLSDYPDTDLRVFSSPPPRVHPPGSSYSRRSEPAQKRTRKSPRSDTLAAERSSRPFSGASSSSSAPSFQHHPLTFDESASPLPAARLPQQPTTRQSVDQGYSERFPMNEMHQQQQPGQYGYGTTRSGDAPSGYFVSSGNGNGNGNGGSQMQMQPYGTTNVPRANIEREQILRQHAIDSMARQQHQRRGFDDSDLSLSSSDLQSHRQHQQPSYSAYSVSSQNYESLPVSYPGGASNADIVNMVSAVVPYPASRERERDRERGHRDRDSHGPLIGAQIDRYRSPPSHEYDYETNLAMLDALSLQSTRGYPPQSSSSRPYYPDRPYPSDRSYPPERAYQPEPRYSSYNDLDRIRSKLSQDEWNLLMRSSAPQQDYYDHRRSRSTLPYLGGAYGGYDDRSRSRDELIPRGPDAKNKKAELYKTELCRSWEETGRCRYGVKCQFAHGESELRPVERHVKYKTELCKTFWETGWCPYGRRCCFIHTQRDLIKKQDDLEKNLIILRKPERRRDDDTDDYATGEWGVGSSYMGFDDRYRQRTPSYDYPRSSTLTNKPPRLQTLEAAEQAAQDLGIDSYLEPRSAPFMPLGAIGSEKMARTEAQGYGAQEQEFRRFGNDSWALNSVGAKEFLPTSVSPILPTTRTEPYGRYQNPAQSDEFYGFLSPQVSPPRGQAGAGRVSPANTSSAYANLLASVSPALNGRSTQQEEQPKVPANPTFGAFSGPFGTAWDGHNSAPSTETLVGVNKLTFGSPVQDFQSEHNSQHELEKEAKEEEDFDRTFTEDSPSHHSNNDEHNDQTFDFGDMTWALNDLDTRSKEEKEEAGEQSKTERHLGARSGSGWDSYNY